MLEKYNALSPYAEKINDKIKEAMLYEIRRGMAPSVFKATRLDGTIHIGFNFQPVGTKLGEKFHYDNGVGNEKNRDALVVWIKD